MSRRWGATASIGTGQSWPQIVGWATVRKCQRRAAFGACFRDLVSDGSQNFSIAAEYLERAAALEASSKPDDTQREE